METQKQGVAYTGDQIFQKASYRFCPHCNIRNAKRQGKDNKGRIRRKCRCGKSFIIDWRVWNFEKLFSELFEDEFRSRDRHASIQYKQRIWKKLLEDEEIQQYISESIVETTLDKSYPDDEKDRYVFIQACIKADQKDSYEASKIFDSWHFLLNVYNPDVTYILEYYCYVLRRKYNFSFPKRQSLQKTLLRCNKCGMNDLSTHGFNNNGRRRIKCNYCQEVSVIRVSHLISHTDLIDFCDLYLQNFTQDQELIQSITQILKHNFSYISKSKEFDRLMAKQPVITYGLKEEMMKVFIGVEILRAKQRFYAETWDMFIGFFGWENNMDSNGYLHHNKSALYQFRPETIHPFLAIKNVESAQEYQQSPLFYEMAAHLHDDAFYDWKSRSEVVFQKLQAELLIK